MSIEEIPFYSELVRKKTVNLGKLYFFEKFLIAEFNEGEIIGYDNFAEVRREIDRQFGQEDFGFIGNRINSYSIMITDAPNFNSTFGNLKAYATVTYSAFASKVYDMENHFFKFNRRNFNSLEAAIAWVNTSLKNTSLV